MHLLISRDQVIEKVFNVFLGLAGYFRRFILHYSEATCPLTELLKRTASLFGLSGASRHSWTLNPDWPLDQFCGLQIMIYHL